MSLNFRYLKLQRRLTTLRASSLYVPDELQLPGMFTITTGSGIDEFPSIGGI